jgi:hypothetical protein
MIIRMRRAAVYYPVCKCEVASINGRIRRYGRTLVLTPKSLDGGLIGNSGEREGVVASRSEDGAGNSGGGVIQDRQKGR